MRAIELGDKARRCRIQEGLMYLNAAFGVDLKLNEGCSNQSVRVPLRLVPYDRREKA